jgi:hypothetical protein
MSSIIASSVALPQCSHLSIRFGKSLKGVAFGKLGSGAQCGQAMYWLSNFDMISLAGLKQSFPQQGQFITLVWLVWSISALS